MVGRRSRSGRPPLSAEVRRGRLREILLRRVLRWTPRRKAAALRGLRQGVVTEDEFCAAQCVPADEVRGWARAAAAHGRAGLLVTRRPQADRRNPPAGAPAAAEPRRSPRGPRRPQSAPSLGSAGGAARPPIRPP